MLTKLRGRVARHTRGPGAHRVASVSQRGARSMATPDAVPSARVAMAPDTMPQPPEFPPSSTSYVVLWAGLLQASARVTTSFVEHRTRRYRRHRPSLYENP